MAVFDGSCARRVANGLLDSVASKLPVIEIAILDDKRKTHLKK